MAKRGQALGHLSQRRRVVESGPRVDRHDDAGRHPLDHPLQFARPDRGHHRSEHRAESGHRQLQHARLPPVRQLYADGVSCPDPQFVQRRREPLGAVGVVPIGQYGLGAACAVGPDRDGVGSLCAPLQQIGSQVGVAPEPVRAVLLDQLLGWPKFENRHTCHT
jgi:hypothetical protein